MPRRAALVAAGALFGGALTVLPVVGAMGIAQSWQGWDWLRDAHAFALPELVVGLSWGWVGLILALRRPGNLMGWVMLAAGLQPLTDLAASAPAGTLGVLGTGFVSVAGLLPLPPFPVLPATTLVLFPDGRPPSRRWWVLVAPIVLAGSAVTAAGMLGVEEAFGVAWEMLGTAGALMLPIGVVSLYVRRRRASATLRRQVRWVLFAMAVSVVLVMGFVAAGRPWIGNVALALVPLAIVASVSRHHLLDIDRLVSRTVAYALVLGILGGAYMGSVVVLGAVGRAATGESGDLVVALSTLGVAALARPVLARVRAAVDRRFDRARYDAARTIDAFARGLRDEVGLDVVVADLTSVAVQTFAPRRADVVLVGRGGPA